jgi:RNA polymerase sigma-70 factor, ECF subfamily
MNKLIAAQLDQFRPDMLRFARLQLCDEAAAEDAVQEAMIGALEAADRFASRAQVKTWVFSILRHKVVDIIRYRCREPSVPVADEIAADTFDPLFDETGHWSADQRPADWGDPEQAFESGQFWQTLDACLHRLPENTARIFMMREFLGLDTGEICLELGVTATNCWVVLHRARMSLRLCLQENWFGTAKESTC